MKNLNCYLFTVKRGLVTRFKEKKFVIYNLIGSQFCAKLSFSGQYVYIIDQARGQDGWILAEFSFCVFMDRGEVEVHKNVKRERGQYLGILIELAWSIKDLLYGIKSTEKKNDLRTCLFSSTEKEPS